MHPDRRALLEVGELRASLVKLQLSVRRQRRQVTCSAGLQCKVRIERTCQARPSLNRRRTHATLPNTPSSCVALLPRTPQVLQRCGWRVLLRDVEELRAALRELNGHPSFAQLCRFVSECALTSSTPIGTHGHSPEAAAAVQEQQAQQQRPACSHASAQTAADASLSTAGATCGPLRASNRQ